MTQIGRKLSWATISCVTLIGLVLLVYVITGYIGSPAEDMNNVFYFFSTLAQTLAALVGLTITGFTLVFNILDGSEKRDESLSEINVQLKKRYYVEVTVLTITSGIAITLDVADLILNHLTFPIKTAVYVATGLINLFAIIFVVWFVIDMINPNKDRRAAETLYKKEKDKDFASSGSSVSVAKFMTSFIKLEKYLREYIDDSGLLKEVIAYRGPSKANFISFRDILTTLLKSEKIDNELYVQLQEITRYRNLVAHARIESVDSIMLDKVQKVFEELQRKLSN